MRTTIRGVIQGQSAPTPPPPSASDTYMEILASGGITVENEIAYDPTDDWELRWRLRGDSWASPPANQYLWSAKNGVGNAEMQFDVWFDITAGDLRISWATDAIGGNQQKVFTLALTNGVETDFRLQFDADDGATNTDVTLFTRGTPDALLTDDTDTWTAISTQTHTSVLSGWNARTLDRDMFQARDGTGNFDGRIFAVVGWQDLTKTTKFLDVDFSDPTNATVGHTDFDEWDNAGTGTQTLDMQGVFDTDWRYVQSLGSENTGWFMFVGP